MIIFLYGKDTYRSRQKLNEIIEHYKKIHKSGLNLKYFDDKTINFEEFKNEIQSVSMFNEKKLIVLKNTLSSKAFKEFIDSKETILLFYEEGEVVEDEFVKLLKKYGKWQEFKLLEGPKLKNWVKKEFEKYQTEVELNALDKLIDFVGNNLWQMSNEIKKLVSYKKEQKIMVSDVELLVRPKIETNIFKTIDYVASQRKKQAIELLKKHLEKGDSPFYLLSMISYQFRNLLIVRELIDKNIPYHLISQKTKLHPYVIQKIYPLAKKFSLPELKKIYQRIFQIDLQIKTGRLNPETALDMFIAEV